MFEKELEFFVSHQGELVEKYRGRTLVLRGEEILGVYDSPLMAFSETAKTMKPGTFMIQRCVPGESAYTVSLNSIGR